MCCIDRLNPQSSPALPVAVSAPSQSYGALVIVAVARVDGTAVRREGRIDFGSPRSTSLA